MNFLLKKQKQQTKKIHNFLSFLFIFFFQNQEIQKKWKNHNYLKAEMFNYNCYYFWYEMICLHFYNEKDKFQNKFLFFLNLFISIDDAHELISLIKTMRRLWYDKNRNNKCSFNKNLNSKNENMFFMLQNLENNNKITMFLYHYFQSALYSFFWKKL